MALAVGGDEPEGLADDLVARVLEVGEHQVQVELVVERAERGDEGLDGQVGVERGLGERVVDRARSAASAGSAT